MTSVTEMLEELLASRMNESAEYWSRFNDSDAEFFKHQLHDKLVWKIQIALTWIELILIPIFVGVGVVGNTLSFVVFVATHLNRTSCHTYLACLAIVDNLFLFIILGSWLSTMNYIQIGTFWCKLSTYLMYVSGFLSIWYVVLFTIERYIVVCFPMKRETMCNARIARRVATIIAVIGLTAHLFTFYVMGYLDEFGICAFNTEFEPMMRAIIQIETFTSLVTPTVIIIACNIRIIRIVRSLHKPRPENLDYPDLRSNYLRRMHELTVIIANDNQQPGQGGAPAAGEEDDCYREWQLPGCRSNIHYRSSGNNPTTTHAPATTGGGVCKTTATHPKLSSMNRNRSSARSTQMRATRMLLLVSTAFLLCNMPRHTLRSLMNIHAIMPPSSPPSPYFVVCMRVSTLFYYLHFAVNVFLYGMSGRSFRVGLQRLKVKFANRMRKYLPCWSTR